MHLLEVELGEGPAIQTHDPQLQTCDGHYPVLPLAISKIGLLTV